MQSVLIEIVYIQIFTYLHFYTGKDNNLIECDVISEHIQVTCKIIINADLH